MNGYIFRAALWIMPAIALSAPPAHAEKPWAFEPVKKIEPPSEDSGWSANPIDRFVRAKQRQRGLSPVGPTDERTLIRRVTFDLTGLPPTPEEVDAFLSDPRPDAYERLVDRLLASPHYGERWGRHWLDVVRYADTGGVAENPLAAKPAHAPARAKHVIFLFMQGGPSHIDTFDPKPLLNKLHGQPLPPSVIAGKQLQFTKLDAAILGCPQTFRKCGRSGLEIADTYPNLQRCADDLAVIRSCYHESFNHAPAQYMLSTGFARMGRPCLGSWACYGLGSESENLPAFVVMATTGDVKGGPPVYDHGFLPGTYQPTLLRNTGSPVLYLNGASGQRDILDLVQGLNEEHRTARGANVDDLSSRIASYELAFRMQSAVPDAVDLSRETEATRRLYGLNDNVSARFGAHCLMARRLVERGVRFVQLFTGSAGADDWDAAHAEDDKTHREMARRTDKPISGLLIDLKARGLLDETLVIWGGEFGRTPIADGRYPDKRAGRDHNPYGFTTWLAGGGVKGGQALGATDEFGFRAVEDRIHVNDLHATILRLLGLDHRKLTYLFEGRQQRLTDVGGDHEFTDRLIS